MPSKDEKRDYAAEVAAHKASKRNGRLTAAQIVRDSRHEFEGYAHENGTLAVAAAKIAADHAGCNAATISREFTRIFGSWNAFRRGHPIPDTSRSMPPARSTPTTTSLPELTDNRSFGGQTWGASS